MRKRNSRRGRTNTIPRDHIALWVTAHPWKVSRNRSVQKPLQHEKEEKSLTENGTETGSTTALPTHFTISFHLEQLRGTFRLEAMVGTVILNMSKSVHQFLEHWYLDHE